MAVFDVTSFLTDVKVLKQH